MMPYQFSEDMARKMKLFYQEEYAKTLWRANELKSILDQMNHIDVAPVTFSTTVVNEKVSLPDTISDHKEIVGQSNVPLKKRKKYKKRKKKSIRSQWSLFIMSRLKATQQPLSYDDMTNHAIAIKNLDKASFDTVRKNIMGAAFSLRTKHHKIDTYAVKGSRTKYLGLQNWFEREGVLRKEFQEKI